MIVQDFIPGQRWVCDTELQLGLGTVLASDFRTVTLVFLANGETRIYAKDSAPLTRVRFSHGDVIESHEAWKLTVDTVAEEDDLLTYRGTQEDGAIASLHEGELSNFIQLNRPQERLFTGQIDSEKLFELRFELLNNNYEFQLSSVRGLVGPRVDLIPHQLYIAQEVASRIAPRVLLADEVGLGKTIEACMILHYQLQIEAAQRVLIIVPESLLHQWLVELLRKFNLHFSIFDEDRCLAIEEHDSQNPFFSEQLVLCSLDFLVENEVRYTQIINAQWDLLIVDEAHHLQWSMQQVSKEYGLIEKLAELTAGILLLTATPEQLGRESHFARLKLLDPHRFYSFEAFCQQESQYYQAADVIDALFTKPNFSSQDMNRLEQIANKKIDLERINCPNEMQVDVIVNSYREMLINELVDRHGTSRVLFRNTRNVIKNFSKRQLIPYCLALPQEYQQLLSDSDINDSHDEVNVLFIAPELFYREQQATRNFVKSWWEVDSRIAWLGGKLKELKREKVLLICVDSQTAMDLEMLMRERYGVRSAVFQEHMTIIDRDRAAAYFADTEYGAQMLICSEIGSEGRNFQFSHHLILFDLPPCPDLLEQRIGRLDRIGQQHTVCIHVPYFDHNLMSILFHFYHDGLNAIENSCPAAQSVFNGLLPSWLNLIVLETDEFNIEPFIQQVQLALKEKNQELQQGRDRLLEYNSYRKTLADHIKQSITDIDQDVRLQQFFEKTCDSYGIEYEEHGAQSFVIKPSQHMLVSHFPGLAQEGATITYDRATALAHENMEFITWEHPLIQGAMDLILTSEHGNAAVAVIKHDKLQSGTLALEVIFVAECAGIAGRSVAKYFPPTCIHLTLDEALKDVTGSFDLEEAVERIHVNKKSIKAFIKSQQEKIKKMLHGGEAFAQQQLAEIISKAEQNIRESFDVELDRLRALSKVNANVREHEITQLLELKEALNSSIRQPNFRLDALRLIVAS